MVTLKKRFLLVGYYRQWSNVFNYKPYEKIPVKIQEENFENQLKVIKDYKDLEKIIMGHINIDYRIINKSENDKDNYEKSFSKRIKSIQSNLLSNNFKQIISNDTRKGKILDHIYTNTSNKIHKAYIEVDQPSDL